MRFCVALSGQNALLPKNLGRCPRLTCCGPLGRIAVALVEIGIGLTVPSASFRTQDVSASSFGAVIFVVMMVSLMADVRLLA